MLLAKSLRPKSRFQPWCNSMAVIIHLETITIQFANSSSLYTVYLPSLKHRRGRKEVSSVDSEPIIIVIVLVSFFGQYSLTLEQGLKDSKFTTSCVCLGFSENMVSPRLKRKNCHFNPLQWLIVHDGKEPNRPMRENWLLRFIFSGLAP